ncbi:MAG: tRNA adenosine(34) deaminase TadA [Selenomonadaceae bacterium]|nr:tRNA adenosine(34) deaminase TadA [Selenomonadaceae bacterium]
MREDDTHYMKMALMEARRAYALAEVPIGAIIIDEEGELVATGYNRREIDNDATAHAEMIAIKSACEKLNRWRLTGLTLYVTIEPCPMCAGAIIMSRLSRVVYGGYDVKAGAVDSLFNVLSHPGLNHQPDVTAGVLAEECADLMKKFFRERRQAK